MSGTHNTLTERRRKRAYNRQQGYVAAREKFWRKREMMVPDERNDGLRDFTWGDYVALLSYQENHDAICGVGEFWGSLGVDHDHKTKLVRGILCTHCNQHALGSFERFGHYIGPEHEAALAKYLGDPPYARMMRGAPFLPYWTPKRKTEGGIAK
jgi:hypothetical protein